MRKRRLDPDGGPLHHPGTTKYWIASGFQPHFGTTLKDTSEGIPSQWTEEQAVNILINFIYKEKWLNVQLFTLDGLYPRS